VAIGSLAATLALAGTVHALVPTDPHAGHPTYSALELPAAWDVTTGSPQAVIAVVDSGIDPTHPDLAGALRSGHDFVDRDEDATDPPGPHGTAVAGVAAARANNGFGAMGACFSCDVMPLRVLGLDGVAFNTNTAAAIDYAVDHGAAVVNASIYGPHSPPTLRDAVARARAAGVLVVAAAGNEGTAEPQYPAAFPEAVSVGAAAAGGVLTRYSSFGEWVDFAAPECAPVTAIGGETLIGCATSVASPLVAGIVALLRAHAPYASADEIESALARTARPVQGTRFGLVDAAAALAALGNPGPTLRPVVFGTPAVGRTLEAMSGVWSGAGLNFAYQWERCRDSCSTIDGATRPRYTLVPADLGHELRVTVSSPGLASATSATTPLVAALPVSLTRPSIAGRARVGSVLTARLGTWSGTDVKLTPTWLRCRSGSCGAMKIGARYRLRAADRGFRMKLSVLASNALGSVTAFSRPTQVVR
jgi:Subtilase family